MAVRRPLGRSRLDMTTVIAAAAFAVAIAFAVYPVFSHPFISLNDVYNHVARAPVLAHYDDVPAFQQYWHPNWRLVPYVGFDLVALALLPWFSLGVIVKLITAMTLVCLLAGAVALSRAAHGKWSASALICALLLLNRTLLAGFVNYLFGIGLCLIAAAAWIALRQRSPVLRIVVLMIFATALSTIHLFACAVLGLTVAGIELADFMSQRAPVFSRGSSRGYIIDFPMAVAWPALAFIPAFLLVVFAAPHPGFHLSYGSMASRIAAFGVPLTYAPVEEAAGFLVIAAAIVALWFVGQVRVDHRLATAAGLLAVIQLLMPDEIGTVTVVDHRIPIAIWFLLFCAIDVHVRKTSVAAGLVALVAAVFVSRVSIVQTQWTKDNVLYNEAHRDLTSLPATARVATAYPPSGLNSATRPAVALYYLPVLEFVPNDGFTQTAWTIPDQHSLVMREPFRQLSEMTSPTTLWDLFVGHAGQEPVSVSQDPVSVSQEEALAAIRDYDYIVFLDAEPFVVPPTGLLKPVREGPGIKIYQVLHQTDRDARG